MEQESKKVIYAGFFTRLMATLVDLFIVSIILSIVRFAIDAKSIVILVVVWWLYTTVMLIKWRTTIGGKLFGIEILDSEQKPLSFKSASLRFIVSITPFLLYILIRGMQHDMVLAPSPTVQQLPQLLFFLPPILMFFTKKRQMIHDILVHSVVVDTSEIKRAAKEGGKSVGYVAQKTLRIGGTLLFLSLIGYLVLYVSVFYTIGKQSHDAYNASFEHKYTVNDYNDSRIIFYNQELEKHSQAFIEAKGMYEIFESDVKKDLALNCIQYYLKEHNDTDWISSGSNFRKNARNKHAISEDSIKNAKRNESHMGANFYVYELNDVNDIEDDIANVWGEKNANKNTCDINMPAEKMYGLFLPKYIKRYTRGLNSSIIDGEPSLKDHRAKKEKWLKEITESCKESPGYETFEQRLQTSKQNAIKLMFARAKGLGGHELDDGIRGRKISNTDLIDEEGRTPLFYLINTQNTQGEEYLLKHYLKDGADLNHTDNYGKTLFDYINNDTPSYSVKILSKFIGEDARKIETPYKKRKKTFESESTRKTVAGKSPGNVQGETLISTSMLKRAPSSAGEKSIIFENFIRKMLEDPIKKLDTTKAIELGIVPEYMVKNGEVISAEGAKVTLRGVWGNGLAVTYKGISSTREDGYPSPCSRLVTMITKYRPTIDGKSYPAPDAININRKVFYSHSTSPEQIQKACERKNPANVYITLRDYTKEDFMVLKPSEWNIREYKKIDMEHTYTTTISSEKELFAFAGRDHIYIHMKDKELRKVPFSTANYIKFLKDGKTIVAAKAIGEVVFIDILTGEMSKPILETRGINAATLSPDEKFLSVVTHKGEFRIIDLEKRTTHKVHSVSINEAQYNEHLSMQSVAYSPDGKTIVMGANSENLIIYDVESDSFKEPIKINNARTINALVFINNNTLLSGGNSFLAKVDLKAQDYAKYKPLRGKKNISIESMDLSPNGKYLAITGDPTLIYDLKMLRVIDRLGGRKIDVKDLKFISDKKLLSATNTKKDAVKFWKFK